MTVARGLEFHESSPPAGVLQNAALPRASGSCRPLELVSFAEICEQRQAASLSADWVCHCSVPSGAGVGRLMASLVQPGDFEEGGSSCKCFVHSIFHNRPHSEQSRLAPQVLGRFAAERHLSQGGVHDQ
jgi:hypothetical protein